MLEAILHPSDLSLGTNAAFLHALRIALEAKGELTILHSQRRSVADEADWHSFPGVRATLSRWGLIADDAPESAVESQLGVLITKAELYDPSPVRSVVRWLEGHGCDLLVMATHSREGLERWLRGSVSVDLARQTPVPSLFLPISAPGFVNPDSGKAVIRNILIPVDRDPHPSAAVVLALELADLCGGRDAVVHLLHVGTTEEAPIVEIDPRTNRRLKRHTRSGPVIDAILAVAEELQPDFIAMSTRGRQGFLDAVRGSTTERVLREAKRPLLAVPAVE
jgi:nucleotide-binding universal stress UspA family protein